MKKNVNLVIVILISFILTGCISSETDSLNETKPTHSLAEDGMKNVSAPEGCEIVSDMEKFKPVTEDQSYNSKTDINTSSARYAVADMGDIVYIGIEHYLGYIDKKTGNISLVCGKPDCEHNSTMCNAYFFPSLTGLQYYNGELYTINAEQYCLVKLSTDGTKREKVLELLPNKEGLGSMYIEWFIHRGYIYYAYRLLGGSDEDTYYLNNSNCLYRKALDGKSEAECIMALPVNSSLDNLKWYGIGSYVYIVTPDNIEDGGRLYRYNTESGKLEWFKDFGSNITGVAQRNNNIYFIQNNENKDVLVMYVYDNETKEKKELFKLNSKSNRMYYDNDYIYLLYGTGELGGTYLGIWNWNGEHLADMLQEMKETPTGAELIIYSEADIDNIYLYASIIVDNKENSLFGNLISEYRIVKYIEKEDVLDGEYEIKEWSK